MLTFLWDIYGLIEISKQLNIALGVKNLNPQICKALGRSNLPTECETRAKSN